MKYLLFVFAFFISIQASGQQWHTSLADAQSMTHEQDKNIILVFSGSDWCAPCIKLDKNIWQSEAFKNEATKSWILVKADFPKKKANQLSKELQASNAALSEKYNREGNFPLVVVLDKNGKVLGKAGFKNVTPQEYIHLLHSFEKK